jgi:hypothetical protein
MVKTILVPTDFRVESLNTLKYALKKNHIVSDVKVILLHTEILSDSITDLLFYSTDAVLDALITPTFEEALSIIKNRYENIMSIAIEVTHGNNHGAFRRFLAARKVDEVYIPQSYTLHLPEKSFDPLPLLRKSGCPVCEIDWDATPMTHEKDQLDELFKR